MCTSVHLWVQRRLILIVFFPIFLIVLYHFFPSLYPPWNFSSAPHSQVNTAFSFDCICSKNHTAVCAHTNIYPAVFIFVVCMRFQG